MRDPRRPSVERLRRIVGELPGSIEKLSHGEPSWFVRGRQFAFMADYHHDQRVAVWIAAPPGLQEMLVAADPMRFFRPPYVGHRGWLGVYLDVDVDWDELAAMLTDAHALISAKRAKARPPARVKPPPAHGRGAGRGPASKPRRSSAPR